MINDAVIANRVREAILLNERISAQDIIVICQGGVVTLTGDVEIPQQVQLAEETAASVRGVTNVVNALHVRPSRWPPIATEVLPWRGGAH